MVLTMLNLVQVLPEKLTAAQKENFGFLSPLSRTHVRKEWYGVG